MKCVMCVAAILSLLGINSALAQSRALAEQASRCAAFHEAGEASRIKVGMAPKPELAARKKAGWLELAKKADPTMPRNEMERIVQTAATSFAPMTDAFFKGISTKVVDKSFNNNLKLWGRLTDECEGVARKIGGVAP